MIHKKYLLLLLPFTLLTSFQQNDVDAKKRKTCYVEGRFLYAYNGEKIILRGINKMNVVTDRTGEKSFPEIAKTCTNCVRIMWMISGGGGKQLDTIIGNCLKNKMQPVIQLHDATGKWNKLDKCVHFWLQKDVVAVIKKIPEIPVAQY